jgi:hypothetical protein
LIQALPRGAWLRQGASAVRARAATTPGRLWVVSVVVIVQALLLWVLGSTALISTRSAIDTIGGRTVPSIFEAQMIHETLAEADRSAANAYLLGDLETSGARQDYEQEMSDATRALEQTAEHSGTDRQATQALQDVITLLTQYSGLVETARANNRQGYTVGVAYLRAASALMHEPRDGILARVDRLADVRSQSLADQNASLWLIVAMLGAFFVVDLSLLVVLMVTQGFLRRRFQRRWSLRLLAATVLVVGLTGLVGMQTFTTYRSLVDAQQREFTTLHNLWQMDGLIDDANGQDSLMLVDPSNSDAFNQFFQSDTNQLVDRQLTDDMVAQAAQGNVQFGGDLADAIRNASSPPERRAVVQMLRGYQHFMQADAAIRAKVGSDHQAAVALAVGTNAVQLSGAFRELDGGLDTAIVIDRSDYNSTIASAQPRGMFGFIIPALCIAIAALTFWGLRPRLAEYGL